MFEPVAGNGTLGGDCGGGDLEPQMTPKIMCRRRFNEALQEAQKVSRTAVGLGHAVTNSWA